MTDIHGRHELKHYINTADYLQLRSRLRSVAQLDEHAGEDGGYLVRSLYFDNYSDKAVVEKLSGLNHREKYRLRYYQNDSSFIRLEKKSKSNRLCYKQDTTISHEQCMALLAGDFSSLKEPERPLLMELYSKMRFQNLRPKTVVEYHREAYKYHAGKVRVTFDSNIRVSNSITGFLNPGLVTIPATTATIMEIKFDGFLPDIIRDILQIGSRNQAEFSKYVVARLV